MFVNLCNCKENKKEDTRISILLFIFIFSEIIHLNFQKKKKNNTPYYVKKPAKNYLSFSVDKKESRRAVMCTLASCLSFICRNAGTNRIFILFVTVHFAGV